MIVGLLLGKSGSRELPNKNLVEVCGKPLMCYPLEALSASAVGRVFVSTDSARIAEVGLGYGTSIIYRPAHLATDDALMADVISHSYKMIHNDLGLSIEFLVLLLCNSPTVTPALIDKGIELLRENEDADSCATFSRYNEYNPARAMRIVDGHAVAFNLLTSTFSTSNRDSLGDVYFYDGGMAVMRTRCVIPRYGRRPYTWLGKRCIPLVQEGGLDVDNERGLVQAEWWLRENGICGR